MFPRIAHLCVHIVEVKYHERKDENYDGVYSSHFYLTQKTLDMDYDYDEVVPFAFFTSIATHYSSINELSISTYRTVDIEEGILLLAKSCTALKIARLFSSITDATLVEFCRLHPNLQELHLHGVVGSIYTAAGVRQALPLMPGFSCKSIVLLTFFIYKNIFTLM